MNFATERKRRRPSSGNNRRRGIGEGAESSGMPFLFPPRLYDQRLGIKIFRAAALELSHAAPQRTGKPD
ncbi:MAG: hypothetical protein M0P70_04365 [Desulfobulbaceae bacterium]|nr:hypothetical protein [Desulfobulbaceae bacterium]